MKKKFEFDGGVYEGDAGLFSKVPNGHGTITYKDGWKLECDFVDGTRDGKATFSHSSGAYFKYTLNNGKTVKGDVCKRDKDGNMYYGEILEDDWTISGKGKIVFASGKNRYEGDLSHDLPQGKGTWFYLEKGNRYEGDFHQGKMMGYGSFYMPYADNPNKFAVFTGEFFENHPLKGTYDYGNGKKFTGLADVGGYRITDVNAEVVFQDGFTYKGGVVKNTLDGKGQLFNKEGKLVYDGEWFNSCYHGLGKVYDADGNVIQEGLFEKGKFIGSHRVD